MPESPHYLSMAEAGAEFPGGKSARAVKSLIKKGVNGIRLHAVYDGQRYWTTADWVEDYLQAQSVKKKLLSDPPAARAIPWDEAVKLL